MKPCYHLANVQRIHVVSVCLHYGNIIWLPWQRPLENKVQIHHGHVKRFHMVKNCENRSSTSGDIRRNTPNHDVNTQRNFHLAVHRQTTGPIFKIIHDVVALVVLLNNVYTRRYHIPFLNARATKVRSLPFFSQNRLPWQRPLRHQKKRSRSIICTQNAFI